MLEATTTAYNQYFHQDNLLIPAGARALATFWTNLNGSSDNVNVQGGVEVRQVDASIAEAQSSVLTLTSGSTTWQQVPLWRVDVPGSAQYVTNTCDSIRAYGTSAAGTPYVWFDAFWLGSLSTGMTYNGDGQVVAAQNPDGTIFRTVYDRYGRVYQQLDAKGNATVTNQYDSLNRLVKQ